MKFETFSAVYAATVGAPEKAVKESILRGETVSNSQRINRRNIQQKNHQNTSQLLRLPGKLWSSSGIVIDKGRTQKAEHDNIV